MKMLLRVCISSFNECSMHERVAYCLNKKFIGGITHGIKISN